jgi:hypothetical protein
MTSHHTLLAGAALVLAATGAAANVCPSAADLRDIETQASSRTLGEPELRFLQDELRRALQCRKGQGRYTSEDWRISREARDAQSRSDARDRAAARARAEAMHSAADPFEGDRIAARRLQEDAAREREQRRERRPLASGG